LNGLIIKYNNAKSIQLETAEWKESAIPYTVKETFFRIAQEQLNNIQKHAQADTIIIQLKSNAEYAEMWVKDNGVGFDTNQQRKGIGITNILNRVESNKGNSRFISEPGKGCILSVCIPLIAI